MMTHARRLCGPLNVLNLLAMLLHPGLSGIHYTNLKMPRAMQQRPKWHKNKQWHCIWLFGDREAENMQVHPFSIATHIIRPSAISHWSALHFHGFTEQIPRIINAFTFKKVVTPDMRGDIGSLKRHHAWIIDEIHYEYITVKKKHFFGIEENWIDEFSRIPITDKERTILELFISPRMFGGMSETIGVLKQHIDTLLIEKLVQYACQYGKISVARRLGWTLDKLGVSKTIYAPLLKIHATGYHLLDPTGPNKGKCDSRWMIQNNLVGEI